MPGCALTAANPELILRIYSFLQKHLPDIGLTTQCCATPAKVLGNAEFFDFSQPLKQEFHKNGIQTVITACPNCLKTVREYERAYQTSDVKQCTYTSAAEPVSETEEALPDAPRMSPVKLRQQPFEAEQTGTQSIFTHTAQSTCKEVLNTCSLYEILAELGLPEAPYSDMHVAIHDPCPVRDEPALHAAVRFLLKSRGVQVKEFSANRKLAPCCGSKNMALLRTPQKALAHMQHRVAQSPCKAITSYCQSCVDSMRLGGGAACHILELLFPVVHKNNTPNMQTVKKHACSAIHTRKMGSLKRWINRWKAARAVRKLQFLTQPLPKKGK